MSAVKELTPSAIAAIIYRHVTVGGPDDVRACHLPLSNAEGVLFGVEKAAEEIAKRISRSNRFEPEAIPE